MRSWYDTIRTHKGRTISGQAGRRSQVKLASQAKRLWRTDVKTSLHSYDETCYGMDSLAKNLSISSYQPDFGTDRPAPDRLLDVTPTRRVLPSLPSCAQMPLGPVSLT
jgi:hypothetical protein